MGYMNCPEYPAIMFHTMLNVKRKIFKDKEEEPVQENIFYCEKVHLIAPGKYTDIKQAPQQDI